VEEYLQVDMQPESILQVKTFPHQLIVKEERHGEYQNALSIILSLINDTSPPMIWTILPNYMRFMEFLAKRRNCKEDMFFVTFMPP